MISPSSFIYSPHPPSPSLSSSLSPPTSPFKGNLHSQTQFHPRPSSPIAIASRPSTTPPRRSCALKYDYRKSSSPVTIANTSSRSTSPVSTKNISNSITMGKRSRLDSVAIVPSSPPSSVTDGLSRPNTPSTPVKIPKNSLRQTQKRHGHPTSRGRKPSNVRSSEDISPSMAALLAVTDIPRPRSQRRKRRSAEVLTVDDVVDGQHVSEKELSWTLSRGPMDVLLSPPEEFADDDASVSECNIGSAFSISDSLPSLGESFATTDGTSSLETPSSPSFRGRRHSPVRRYLQPILSPPGEDLEDLDHPLARKSSDEDLCLDGLPESIDEEEPESRLLGQFMPLKYAFKSNLTASLRALRSAAKSFSTINFSSIPSDDFLTRSLLTIDTKVPFADERRPPVTEEIPSAELRRYLNPTTTSRAETQLAAVPPQGKISASIQMQTYKVQRSKVRNPRSSSPPALSQPQAHTPAQPGMRQREMRENSDFIRIAVMEMAMRKRGKLDDQRPGRARWALPPRKMSTGIYEIGPNGVPARWRSISYESTD